MGHPWHRSPKPAVALDRIEQETRELESRFESERGAMRVSLRPVEHALWWDRANAESIAEMHQTAAAWRVHDDVARGAHETIRREVSERYGIDVDRPGPDPVAVAVAPERSVRSDDLFAQRSLLLGDRGSRAASSRGRRPGARRQLDEFLVTISGR